MKPKFLSRACSLLACVLMILAAAVVRDGRLLGHPVAGEVSAEAPAAGDSVVSMSADGHARVSTEVIGRKIIGYGGPVPLLIYLNNGVVDSVSPLANDETPRFFGRVVDSGLLDSWSGLSAADAMALDVDAVSGATYSSKAVIENVRTGLGYYAKISETPSLWSRIDWSWKSVAGLLAALMAAVLPLFVRDRRYRLAQQVINVAVLGIWCGLFVCYTSVLTAASNGFSAATGLALIVMLVATFVYPLLGRKGYYCANMCPLGSLQELAGRCNPNHKAHLSQRLTSVLTWARRGLWAVLMLALWTGVWASWVDYELFTAFVFETASVPLLIVAALFLILSVFVPRPYCRFVCPTGTLLKLSQNDD